jgi:hypothetical protein
MAKPPTPTVRITKDVQTNILSFIAGVMTARKRFTEIHNKMEAIDIAYARYTLTGEGGDTPCDVLQLDNVVAPIVVSQVDSMVGYLAEVFLSGYPMFPVVSTNATRHIAEQVETLIDDHAILGGYARQLLMFLRDGVKYNLGAVEEEWAAIDQFSIAYDYTEEKGRTVARKDKYFTKLRRLDPYNLIWDYNVNPGDVSAEGDYAGYIEIISRTKLKRLLNKYTATREILNAKEALDSVIGTGTPTSSLHYTIHPTVSDYITPRQPNNEVDWEAYLTGIETKKRTWSAVNNYEKITLYARIVPADFGIISTQPNHPQIWKFVTINGILVHAKRIVSAYDVLPILFGQPIEDGLGYQTQSIAEGEIPIQSAASTLFNIRFAAARRAVSDRALYDASMINPSDINARIPAPKIPVSINPIANRSIRDAYHQIPFDSRGTDSTIQDASLLVDFSKQLSGLNGPQQGQFQKGNKSVTEWNDTMGGSDNRLRLPAITLEHQVFMPLKSMILLNIFQYGEDAVVVSQKTGETVDIKMDELRKHVLSFRVADGYTPKAKMASTEMLTQGMNMLATSPILQQAYGASLPNMFAHLMQLGGVRGLDEYSPERQPTQGGPQVPATTAIQAPPATTMQGEQNAQGVGETPP